MWPCTVEILGSLQSDQPSHLCVGVAGCWS